MTTTSARTSGIGSTRAPATTNAGAAWRLWFRPTGTRNTGATAATNFVLSDVIGLAGVGFNTQAFAYVPGSAQWNGAPLTDAPRSARAEAEVASWAARLADEAWTRGPSHAPAPGLGRRVKVRQLFGGQQA